MPRLFANSPSSRQEQEESKRRSNFAFMKYTSERRTASSMRRSREHAKQIAAQLSEQSPSSFVDFQPFPVTSPKPSNIDQAYNMDVIDDSSHKQKRQSQPVSLDAYVQQQQQHVTSPSIRSSESSSSTKRERNSMLTFPSNSTMQSKNAGGSSAASGSGGAARRRMARAQKHQSTASSSRSDVFVDYDTLEDSSATSPYPLTRSGSSKANHLLNYAQTPRAPIDATPTSNRSLGSSQNSQDAFGFSFDAFGLDESEVNLEVDSALESLVHGSRPELGFFLDEEFPMHNFDSSRGSTPTSDVDGYTDGFRLVNVKQSPTSSEKSSLTSGTNEYNAQVGVNRFKVQAGFHKSSASRGRPPVSPNVMPSPPGQYAKSEPGGANYFTSPPKPFPSIPSLMTEDFPDAEFPDPEPSIVMDDRSDSDYGPAKANSNNRAKSKASAHRSSSPTFGGTSNVYQAPTEKNRKEPETRAYRDPPQTYQQQSPSYGTTSDTGARSDVGVSSDVGVRSDVGVSSDVGAKSDVAIASDVGVASDGGVNSDFGQVPTDIMGRIRSKKSAAQRAEEKAEEEEKARAVRDLKLAWERRQQEEANEAAERLKRRQSARSPLPQAEIARLERELGDELLSPEILEKKQIRGTTVSMLKSVKKNSAPQRAAECEEQRTSFATYRERLKPAHLRDDNGNKDYGSAKSDIVGYGRKPSTEMNAVMNRWNKQKSFGDSPRDSFGESRSDVGSAPAFLTNVKLRSTGSSPKQDERRIQKEAQNEDSQSSFEYDPSQFDNDVSNQFDDEFDFNDDNYDDEGSYYSEDLEWAQEHAEDDFGDDYDSSDEPRPPRKMTYREKREVELKAERERKEAEAKANKEPDRDVAALIRKRIAANKKAAAQAKNEKRESTENISNLRNRLRKVPEDHSESPRESPSAAKKFLPTSQPPSAAQKFLERSSPEFSVKQLKKAPVADKSPAVQSISSATQSNLTMETNQDWTGSGESTSPNMHPPSMVSSEVDSSSTIRTHEQEHSSSLKQQRQATTVVPTESTSREPEGSRLEPVLDEERKEQQTQQHVEEATKKSQPPATGSVEQESISASSKSAKNALNALFGKRLALPSAAPEPPLEPEDSNEEDVSSALMKMHFQQDSRRLEEETAPSQNADGSRPALKDDPKYARYFRMLKVGMPMDVVKHAMMRDDLDPSVMDGDHNKPAGGMPLKEDPAYARYFKMLAMGLPMGAVKNAMERDGLDPAIIDGDHNLPAGAGLSNNSSEREEENRPKDTHRRTRLHWETLRQVRASSLWAKIDNDPELEQIDIDEEEFAELFQAELTPSQTAKSISGSALKKKGAAVRVIESKRANNGGIILARLKMTHDEMADAVDRIDENAITAEQMEHIIEYLPTKEERKALEAYMLEGDQDAAEKFDGLCECEKFMVAMMTVKHAKRKVRALLFKLQFEGCLESLEQDANMVETACDELKNSVRLRKLLGIVLNIGNRLNTAGASGKRKAGAFSLNSLLKLSQAKAFDKKTTFLQYVVLVVQRNNEDLLNFQDDIPTALRADKVYWDQCLSDLEDVENQLENVRRMALYQAKLAQMYQLQNKKSKNVDDDDDESLSDASMTLEEEVEALRSSQIGLFTLSAIKKVSALRDKVEATKVKFTKLLEYFGEEHRRDMQPHDLFHVFAIFSLDFDEAKEKVMADTKRKKREERKRQGGGGSPRRSGSQQASTPSARPGAWQGKDASSDDVLTSPKSDAGVRYSSYPGSFLTENRTPGPRVSQSRDASAPSSLQQHSSTMNGMYSTPKQLSSAPRKSRGDNSARDREAALRQKARMRRRMLQQQQSSSGPPEEGRPPRSAEKSGASPR